MANWRWAETPPKIRETWPDFTHYAQIRSDEGKWINPDCAYDCPYCGACLGCLMKQYPRPGSPNHDPDDPGWYPRDFDCPASPDGDHHLVEKPDKN